MRASVFGVFSALVALASAYTSPDYSQPPLGNPIHSPLTQIVPAGKPFDITWTPTTPGNISLVLLRGPSTNVQPLMTLVDNTPNTGSFMWTPSLTLQPDTTHYGLLLVVEGTGQYQYSNQFGISNPAYESSTASSSMPATTSSSMAATSSTAMTSATSMTSATMTSATMTMITPTTIVTTTICPATSSSAVIPMGTGYSSTKVSTAPSSTSTAPVFTGAAGHNAVSFGALAAGVFAVLTF